MSLKSLVMSKNCLKNVDNYANQNNAVNIANSLTCRFTWLYLEAQNEVITGDQTTLPTGETISAIDVEILDGSSTALASGTAAAPITVDVSGLDNSKSWRINYTVTTASGLTCTVFIFIDPTVPEVITGSSDSNFLPLPLLSLIPTLSSHPIEVYEQDFTGLTTWIVTHNTGLTRPASLEVYDATDSRVLTGITIIDADSFSITFSAAKTGKVKTIFIK